MFHCIEVVTELLVSNSLVKSKNISHLLVSYFRIVYHSLFSLTKKHVAISEFYQEYEI